MVSTVADLLVLLKIIIFVGYKLYQYLVKLFALTMPNVLAGWVELDLVYNSIPLVDIKQKLYCWGVTNFKFRMFNIGGFVAVNIKFII